jgi:cytochrome c peroxidase
MPRAGDTRALSAEAARGMELFYGKLQCDRCHGGANFTNEALSPRCYPVVDDYAPGPRTPPSRRRVKTPTLRNVALTRPYLHNGSIDTLEGVLAFYENTTPDPGLPAARISLGPEERRALVSFLEALTGEIPTVVAPALP